MKTGRNEPCPCGSGKKYKHCCYGKESERPEPVIAEGKTDASDAPVKGEESPQEKKKGGGDAVKPPHDPKKDRRKFYGGGSRRGGGPAASPRIHRGAQRGS